MGPGARTAALLLFLSAALQCATPRSPSPAGLGAAPDGEPAASFPSAPPADAGPATLADPPTPFPPGTANRHQAGPGIGLLLVARARTPIWLMAAPDGSGRLLVVEKAGRVRLIREGHLESQPFLDIAGRVGSQGFEQGLLGLAFAADFAHSGVFYASYTDRAGDSVIARFRAGEGLASADPNSEEVLLRVPQPHENHNGGHIEFGPDGYLWVGLGDGGPFGDPDGRAQDGGSLLGKLLRLDVSGEGPYRIPPDNPFLDRPEVRDEIWALGLRNPWRFSFDPLSQDLYLADPSEQGQEEVNFLPAGSPGGANFGWSIMEGERCFKPSTGCDPSGLVGPVATYPWGGPEGDCSVIGGSVYRGRAIPDLDGRYLLGDFCSGRIRSLGRDAAGRWELRLEADTELNIASFGSRPDGELYLLDFSGGGIYRLQPASGSSSPKSHSPADPS